MSQQELKLPTGDSGLLLSSQLKLANERTRKAAPLELGGYMS